MTWLTPIAVRSQRPSSRRSGAAVGATRGMSASAPAGCIMKLRCRTPTSIVKPRDVMPRGGAHAAGEVLRRRKRTSRARWSGSSGGCGSARAAPKRSSEPGQFVLRDVAGDSVIVTRSASQAACMRSTTSAATEARGSAPKALGHVRGKHPVPLPRVDLRPRRPADRRAAHGRGSAFPQGGLSAAPRAGGPVGRPHLPEPRGHGRRRFCDQLADLPAKFHPWRMQDLRARAAGSSTT